MKYKILAVAVALLLSFLITEKLYAGAWTVPKYKVWGEYYIKWDYAKNRFTHEGKRKPLAGNDRNARSWEFVMEPKLEYGVTDWFTFLSSLEYKEAHYKENSEDRPWRNFTDFARKNHGVTNVKVGGRLRLMEKPFVLSTQSKFFIYPGYGNDHGERRGRQDFVNIPAIGKGDDAFEQKIMIGKSFSVPLWGDFRLPCYAGAETGYRWRTRAVCDDIPYFVEGGFWPTPYILIKSELDGYKCNPATGSIKESYGVWRIGWVWQIFGDSVLREGNKMFNIEFQYGMYLWGKDTTNCQEGIVKVQTQF